MSDVRDSDGDDKVDSFDREPKDDTFA